MCLDQWYASYTVCLLLLLAVGFTGRGVVWWLKWCISLHSLLEWWGGLGDLGIVLADAAVQKEPDDTLNAWILEAAAAAIE